MNADLRRPGEPLACVGETRSRGVLAGPDDQIRSKPCLKFSDVAAHRTVRDLELAGCRPYATGSINRFKGAQGIEPKCSQSWCFN